MNRGFKESTWDRGLHCEIPLREQWKLLSPFHKAKWSYKDSLFTSVLLCFPLLYVNDNNNCFFHFSGQFVIPAYMSWLECRWRDITTGGMHICSNRLGIGKLPYRNFHIVLGNLHIIHLIVRQCMCLVPWLLVLKVSTLPLGYWNVWIRELDWSCRACWNKKQNAMYWPL